MNITTGKKINSLTKFSLTTYKNISSKFQEERVQKKFRATFIKRKKDWAEKINSLPSIEQKLVELNMPKLFKYKATFFNEYDIPFNGLKFIKFVTKTHIEKALPIAFYSEDAHADEICKELEDEVKETILADLATDRNRTDQFFCNLNMMLIRKLQKHYSHLESSTIDYNPKIDAFWFMDHPDLQPSLSSYLKIMNLPTEKYKSIKSLRSEVRPDLVLRTRMPLPVAVDIESNLCSGQEIEFCKFQPNAYGFQKSEKRAVILPGYFPGVLNEHGHIFFYNLDRSNDFSRKFGDKYIGLAHQQRAVNAGFTQAYSHAFFEGATPFRNPERPVTQQTVFSDGKQWVFSVYQLNKCNFNFEEGENNQNNVLWLEEPVQLFETIENNKVMGYNTDVLKTLVKMYMREPEIVPEPDKSRFLMNFDASDDFKDEFHRLFRRLMSEGNFYGRKEREVAMWEYIYKIKFDSRPFEAKRRFYEVPWRNTPDHLAKISDLYPKYIHGSMRAHKDITHRPRINTKTLLKYDAISVKRGHPKNWDMLTQTAGIRKRKDLKGDEYLLRDY